MIIEDFGQKIGGARKDLAAGNLVIDDLFDMNEEERNKYVQKKYIWKSENGVKAVHEGKDRTLAYWQYMVWRCIPAHPVRTWTMSIKEAEEAYVRIVTDIRDKVMNTGEAGYVIDDSGKKVSFYSYLKDTYVESSSTYSLTLKKEAYAVIDNKLIKLAQAPQMKLYQDAMTQRYGMTDEEKVNYTASIMYIIAPVNNDKPQTGQCFIEHGSRPHAGLKVSGGTSFYYGDTVLSTAQDGMFLILNQRSREVLAAVPTWETAEEKRASYEEAFIKNHQPAQAADVKKNRKKAFPRQLVNVRQNGGNVVSDERMVTGDDYLDTFAFRGGEFGNWMGERDRVESMKMGYTSFLNLASILGFDSEDISFNGTLAIAFGSRGRGHAAAHFEPLRNVINLTKPSGAGCLAHEYGHALDHFLTSMELSDVAKPVIKAMAEAKEFKKQSAEFDKLYSKQGNGYWGSQCEMFARAFDCFVKDRLKEAGIEDTYLTAYADAYSYKKEDGSIIRAYPTGSEREAINRAFSDVLSELKRAYLK